MAAVKECSVPECGFPFLAKGYCAAHYRRFRLGGDLTVPVERKHVPQDKGPCAVESCDRLAVTKGFCATHYTRSLKGLDMDAPIRKQVRKPCSVEGCDGLVHTRGLCGSCYRRARYHGEIAGETCAAVGCARAVDSNGYCGMHYARVLRGIPLDAPQRRPVGDGSMNNGYLRTTLPDQRSVAVHRLVMEGILGRPLHAWENVHHINGVRHDNRPQNLELWAKPQPNGQRVEDLVRWVVEEYRDEVVRLLADPLPFGFTSPPAEARGGET